MVVKRFIIILSLILTATIGFAAGDVLYKWKDAEGNTKYGDRPPKGIPFERIKVRSSGNNNSTAAITQKLGESKQDNSDVQSQLDKAKEQMNQMCKIAKANLSTLNTASRISVVADDGGKRLMTDEERAAKKAETQQKVKEFCADES